MSCIELRMGKKIIGAWKQFRIITSLLCSFPDRKKRTKDLLLLVTHNRHMQNPFKAGA